MSTVICKSIEDVLNSEGFVTYKVRGKSMEPMILPNCDIVTIRRKNDGECFQENDVVLYRQKDKLTLHRIVQINGNGEYVLLGDNCSRKEYGVRDEDILGILICFKHLGSYYEINDERYIAYIDELRITEKRRMARKLVYDILVRRLSFLPSSFYGKIKSILKKLILCKIHLA